MACLPWLEAEIERVAPAVVVLLGATASQALLGNDVRVTKDRGTPMDLGGRPVVVTVHPAAVLRAGDDRDAAYQALVDDLGVAVDMAQGL